jgi:hypothetical protein
VRDPTSVPASDRIADGASSAFPAAAFLTAAIRSCRGRQGPDAERLQGKAQEARQCAAQEVCGL